MQQTKLGEAISSLRKENHMTQAALAEKLGVTDKAVSKWERGISYPDISQFPKLANVFGLTIDELVKNCVEGERPATLLRIFKMSHCIRTPLNIILGCADLATDYTDDKEKLLRYLENIRVSGQYLLNLIESAKTGELADVEEFQPQDLRDESRDFSGSPAPPASAPVAIEDFDFSGKRILLAEDMEINREITLELLRKTGAEVDFAEDGKVCVEKITSSPPGYYDLILMDINMPNMDGLEATREIRDLPDDRKASVPIIAMTASVCETDREAAFEAGMDDFTEKPIISHTLLATMKQHL